MSGCYVTKRYNNHCFLLLFGGPVTRVAVIHRIIKNILPPTERAAIFCDNGIPSPKVSYLYFYGERKQASKVGMRLCKKLSLGDRRERAVGHVVFGLGSLRGVPRY